MQLVIGRQDGKTFSLDLDETQEKSLHGQKVGDEFDGSVIGLDGYTLKITGGSDKQGFPMKQQLHGTGRRRILVKQGVGVRDLTKGERRRKSIRGNTISDDIEQINCTITEEGNKSIEELLGDGGDEAGDEDDEGDE